MGWEPPSEDEFNNEWVLPEDALGPNAHRLEGYREKSKLMERLKGGAIIAVARTAQLNPTVDHLERLVRVRPGAWRAVGLMDSHFWDTGDLITGEGGVTGYGDSKTVRYFDVRFDPDTFSGSPPPRDLQQEIEERPPPRPPEPEPVREPEQDIGTKTALSESLLKKWAGVFNEAYPNGSEALAAKSVSGMFPDKHVTRERLRRVLPERQRGRPRKTNDLDNSPKNDGE